MPPARVAHFAREPAFDKPVAKDLYDASQPLSTGSSQVFRAFSPYGSSTGQAVTAFTKLTSAAVYACVRCLAQDVSKLPFQVLSKLPRGGWDPAPAHPVARLLRRPNRWQTTLEFISYVVSCLQMRGNAYVVVVRDKDGNPRGLIPISPDRCTELLSPGGWIYYQVSHPLAQHNVPVVVHQDDMLHVKNMSMDGFTGLSPLAVEQEVVGLALATQKHGGVLFRQGTQATGVLKHPGNLSKAAQDNISQSLADSYSGVEKAHKVLVLEEGMTFEKLSMTNEEAQFLASRAFSVEEICRIYRVPPHKVSALDKATFSNIENQEQAYINDSLIWIARSIEQVFEYGLLFEDERARFEMRFDFDELLRGDMKSRYDAYHVALGDGWMNRNQVRARERMAPFDGGDDYRVALNTESVKPERTPA